MNKNFLKNKKVLITGGAGLLGVSLTKLFISLNADVISTYHNRLPPKKYKKYYRKYDFNNFQDCMSATQNIDYVLISAVQASGVSQVKSNPTLSILPNLKIHAGLFEACSQNNVKKVVWISSSSVYQDCNHPIAEDELDLNLPTYELYLGIGWVYRYLEQLAKCYYLKKGLNIGIIRTSNIYGPYDRFDDDKSHVIPALIKRAMNKENPFVVWGNKNTVRDFVYSDDLSCAVVEILEKYCKADPINFSSGNSTSIEKLVRLILEISNHKTKLFFDVSKPTAIPFRVLNNKKYKRLFKYSPKTTLKEGLQKTIKWYNSFEFRE
tara:strand:+ start:108 stop:1073 length:966 start_codon:yes stop_codon:yes gene_type:complete